MPTKCIDLAQAQERESSPKRENAGDGMGGRPEAAESSEEIGHWDIGSS
ncbi:MAG: hypothetical protein LBU32_07630 [Clostridiales bacterium]|nr:hypothetical protein [Clostridiales bacterium]